MSRDKYHLTDPGIWNALPRVPAKISGALIFSGKDYPFLKTSWL
jgi:hypothetical protein